MFSAVSACYDYVGFPSLSGTYSGVDSWQKESFACFAVLATIEAGNGDSGGH